MTTGLHHPAGSLGEDGDHIVLTPEIAGWQHCGLRVCRLAPGESQSFDTENAEVVVLPLSGGGGSVEAEGTPLERRMTHFGHRIAQWVAALAVMFVVVGS